MHSNALRRYGVRALAFPWQPAPAAGGGWGGGVKPEPALPPLEASERSPQRCLPASALRWQVVHFEHFHRRVHDAFGALDALAPKSTAGAACAAEPAWIPSSTAVFSAGAAGTSDDENEGPIPRFY